LDADAYATLDAVADRVTALAGSVLDAAAVPHVINRAGNLFSVFFTADPVVDIQSARSQDTKAYARFFHAALDAGLWLPPSAFEAWFVSTSHGAEELTRIGTALEAAAAAARGGAVD
jgi:glutamate-1-semialdehyde 2,1-aminomutase